MYISKDNRMKGVQGVFQPTYHGRPIRLLNLRKTKIWDPYSTMSNKKNKTIPSFLPH